MHYQILGITDHVSHVYDHNLLLYDFCIESCTCTLFTFTKYCHLQQIKNVIEAIQTRLVAEPKDYSAAQSMNDATVELAHYDLPYALDVALAHCPEIDDSTRTRTATLTHILILAAASR